MPVFVKGCHYAITQQVTGQEVGAHLRVRPIHLTRSLLQRQGKHIEPAPRIETMAWAGLVVFVV